MCVSVWKVTSAVGHTCQAAATLWQTLMLTWHRKLAGCFTAGRKQEAYEREQRPVSALGVCTTAAGAGHIQVTSGPHTAPTTTGSSSGPSCISTGGHATPCDMPCMFSAESCYV